VSDCILAQLTANRKAALKLLTIANGYSFTYGAVEEKRTILNINGRYPYIQLLKSVVVENELNDLDHIKVMYAVLYEDVYNDESTSGDEIIYHFRNVNADIVKAWMVDRTCGGLASLTKVVDFDDDVIDENGSTFYRSYVIFEVETHIDSNNPYQKG